MSRRRRGSPTSWGEIWHDEEVASTCIHGQQRKLDFAVGCQGFRTFAKDLRTLTAAPWASHAALPFTVSTARPVRCATVLAKPPALSLPKRNNKLADQLFPEKVDWELCYAAADALPKPSCDPATRRLVEGPFAYTLDPRGAVLLGREFHG